MRTQDNSSCCEWLTNLFHRKSNYRIDEMANNGKLHDELHKDNKKISESEGSDQLSYQLIEHKDNNPESSKKDVTRLEGKMLDRSLVSILQNEFHKEIISSLGLIKTSFHKGNRMGTGFFLNKCFYITAAHNLISYTSENDGYPQVEPKDIKIYPFLEKQITEETPFCRVLAYNISKILKHNIDSSQKLESDIAVLLLDQQINHFDKITFAERIEQRYDDLMIYGYTFQNKQYSIMGGEKGFGQKTEGKRQQLFDHYISTEKGFSGAPIFCIKTENNCIEIEIVGIHIATKDQINYGLEMNSIAKGIIQLKMGELEYNYKQESEKYNKSSISTQYSSIVYDYSSIISKKNKSIELCKEFQNIKLTINSNIFYKRKAFNEKKDENKYESPKKELEGSYLIVEENSESKYIQNSIKFDVEEIIPFELNELNEYSVIRSNTIPVVDIHQEKQLLEARIHRLESLLIYLVSPMKKKFPLSKLEKDKQILFKNQQKVTNQLILQNLVFKSQLKQSTIEQENIFKSVGFKKEKTDDENQFDCYLDEIEKQIEYSKKFNIGLTYQDHNIMKKQERSYFTMVFQRT